jgi:hypothetical protein
MSKNIIVGQNFLHPHVQMQVDYVIPPDHVIVDKRDWEQIVGFFMIHPELVQELLSVKEFPLPEKPNIN